MNFHFIDNKLQIAVERSIKRLPSFYLFADRFILLQVQTHIFVL